MSKYIRKRYIDAEALKSYLNPIARKTDCHFLQLIDNIPTADVEEVQHGKWIKMWYQVYECSCCKRSVYLEGLNVTDENETEILRELYPYCHCGAKMDGGKDNAK